MEEIERKKVDLILENLEYSSELIEHKRTFSVEELARFYNLGVEGAAYLHTRIQELPTRIIPTPEMAKRLAKAQLEHTRQILNELAGDDYQYGDDTYDDVKGALALSQELITVALDGNVARLDTLLNSEYGDGLSSFAGGGICDAIWELKPHSLKWSDE